MKNKIRLSYSSLSNLHNGHEWINKQLGIPVPDYSFLSAGKEAHNLIQRHVSGKDNYRFLQHINIHFPIVEEKDFDERCKFTFPFGEKYEIFGFVDGRDDEEGRILEIKTSGNGAWGLTKYRDSIQRKIYGMALQHIKEAYLITGSSDPQKWEKEPPKLYSLKYKEKDIKDAFDWITKGIEILESGNFKGGLDENGKCTGCFWNMDRYPELANCHFL